MKRKSRKGFTIVELVIVIAVIAILAAVLIPTFGGVIDKANESKALQQARHLYTEYLVVKNGQPEAEELYVKVTVGTTNYYFLVSNGTFNTDASNTKPGSGKIIASVISGNVIYEQ